MVIVVPVKGFGAKEAGTKFGQVMSEVVGIDCFEHVFCLRKE